MVYIPKHSPLLLLHNISLYGSGVIWAAFVCVAPLHSLVMGWRAHQVCGMCNLPFFNASLVTVVRLHICRKGYACASDGVLRGEPVATFAPPCLVFLHVLSPSTHFYGCSSCWATPTLCHLATLLCSTSYYWHLTALTNFSGGCLGRLCVQYKEHFTDGIGMD